MKVRERERESEGGRVGGGEWERPRRTEINYMASLSSIMLYLLIGCNTLRPAGWTAAAGEEFILFTLYSSHNYQQLTIQIISTSHSSCGLSKRWGRRNKAIWPVFRQNILDLYHRCGCFLICLLSLPIKLWLSTIFLFIISKEERYCVSFSEAHCLASAKAYFSNASAKKINHVFNSISWKPNSLETDKTVYPAYWNTETKKRYKYLPLKTKQKKKETILATLQKRNISLSSAVWLRNRVIPQCRDHLIQMHWYKVQG